MKEAPQIKQENAQKQKRRIRTREIKLDDESEKKKRLTKITYF